MQRKTIFIGILIGSAVLTGCSSSNKTQTTEIIAPLYPEWVNNRPFDNTKYIGIAGVKKSQYPGNYAQMATNMALNEMAGQIKVQVQSNSMLYTFDNKNGEFGDEYKEFIQTSTNAVLENYVLVNSWEDNDEYWVWYELSKSQYEADKQKRINTAIELSLQYIDQGDNALSDNNSTEALSFYLKAINPIKKFLGEQIQTTVDEENVYLGQYILSKIKTVNQQLKLTPSTSNATFYWGQQLTEEELNFQLNAAGKPVKEFPVALFYSEGRLPRNWVDTDLNGRVAIGLDKVKYQSESQDIIARLDFARFYERQNGEDEILSYLLDQISVVKGEIHLKVTAPKYEVSYQGRVLEASDKEVISSSIDVYLGQKGILVSNADNDLLMTIAIDKGNYGTQYDFHSYTLMGTFTVTDQNKNIIYKESITDVKGVHQEKNQAKDKAVEKLISKFKSTYLPRFYRKFMK